MSTLSPIQPLDLTRSAARFARPLSTLDTPPQPQPEPVSFPEAVPQSEEARVNTLKLDTAVELNRRNTPSALVQKRLAPRYSISQINTLDPEQVRSRLAALDKADRRPGWVKFLDLIDAPRNFVANVATDVLLPEARRMAIERGDFDQFGQPKVFGADMLRAAGLKNDVVNAIAGFAIDVFTDPLTWLGGPVGGLKTVGSRGAAEISTKGQKLLRGGLRTLEKTGSVAGIADDATRTLIESTINAGRAAREIDDVADAAKLSAYVGDTLLGSQSVLSKAAETAKLGGLTKGGALAEDLFLSGTDVVRKARESGVLDPALAEGVLKPGQLERIEAVKNFVSRHTNNPGVLLGLSGIKGGAEIAHIPFTTRTLTVPAFDIPGTRIRVGRAREVQQAVAQAFGKGNVVGGAAIMRAANESEEIRKIAEDLRNFTGEKVAGEVAGEDVSGVIDELAASQQQLDRWLERSKQRGPDYYAGLSTLQTPENVDDLLATAELEAAARADLRKAAASLRLSTLDAGVEDGLSPGIFAGAKRARQAIAARATNELGLTPETAFDALANPERRTEALQSIIDAHNRLTDNRHKAILDLSEENFALAEEYVDTLGKATGAAAEHALLRGGSIRRAMRAEDRLLADAARKILRVSDDEMGMLLTAPLEHLTQRMGLTGWDNSLANLAIKTGVNLGGVGGTQQSVFQQLRRAATGAEDAGNAMATDFSRGRGAFRGSGGLDALAKARGVRGRDYDRLAQWVTMRAENKLREASGYPRLVVKTTRNGEPTPAKLFAERITELGWLEDTQMVARADQLADEVLAVFQKMGLDAIERGDFEHMAIDYLPSQLREKAAARARALHKAGDGPQARIAERTSAALNDPSKARTTNLVQFTGLDGIDREFMLLEADVFGKISADDLNGLFLVDPDAAVRAAQVSDDVSAFKELYKGADDLDGVMRDASRPLLPFELNDYASTGALDGLVGGALVRGDMMFETDMMKLLYNRTRSARVAQAERAFTDIVSPFVVMKIGRDDHMALSGSPKDFAYLKSGEKLQRMSDGRYRLGETVYRHMSESKIDSTSLFVPEMIMGGDFKNALVPEPLVVAMERMNDTLKPQNMGTLMGIADRLTSTWKVSTLWHPSWTIGNAFGNVLLTAMDDPRLLYNPKRAAKYARHFKEAAKALTYRNLDLNTQIMIGGRPRAIGDILEQARETGAVTGGGFLGDLNRQVLRSSARRPALTGASESAGNLIERTVKGVQNRYHDRLSELTHLRGAVSDEARLADKARSAIEAGKTGAWEKGVSAWFGANGKVDDVSRLAYFMHMLDDGHDVTSAGERVRRALLNFGDMSSFERNVVRPLIPFYSWTRASLPAFLMHAVRDPERLSAVPKLVNAFEEAFAGEDRLPRWKRPSYMLETLAVQLSKDPESRMAFQLGTLLPQEGAVSAISGGLGAVGGLSEKALGVNPTGGFTGRDFMDTMSWLYGQAGPAVKIPSELGFGRESFTGRSIGAAAGDGDISLNDYLFGQVRQFREYGVGLQRAGAVERAFDQSTAQGVSRLLIGGRIQSGLSEDKRKAGLYYELRDRESQLRKAIKRAETDGDNADELRVELIKTYADALRQGVDPGAVPKYVREELAQMGLLDDPGI